MANKSFSPIKIEANGQFGKWADGETSCSGMTGNLKGILWFCGIEQGGGNKDYRNFILSGNLQKEPQLFNAKFKYKYPDYLKWPLHRIISKMIAEYLKIKSSGLYSSLNGDSLIEKAKDYHEKYLFNDDLALLMDLYPIDFPREAIDFDDKDVNITNLPDKYIYQLWCRYNRSPHLAQRFINSKEAKILICSSSKASRNDFLSLFGFNIGNLYYHKLIYGNKGKSHLILYFRLKGLDKHVLICPFFGQGGLNDTSSIKALGNIVAEII
jgi:hypothetical protein